MSSISNLTEKLKSYYNSLNSSTIENVVKFMNSKQMSDIYQYYLNNIESKDLEKDEIELLEYILRICNSIYTFTGDSTGLSDTEYDELVEYYRGVTGNDNFFTEKLISNEDTVYHKFKTLRGTLDKIYALTDEDVVKNKSQKTIEDWVQSSERRIRDKNGVTVNLYDEQVIVMPKFDGVSCIIEFDKNGNAKRALLRGDTSRNETTDVYNIIKDIIESPLKNPGFEYGLKTEIMMTNEDFEEYNEKYHTDYKNSRSIVSSILNSDEADDRAKYLKIIPLRISYLIDGEESEQELPETLFQYPYIKCKLKELDKIRKYSFTVKFVDGLRCDGSVIYLCNRKVQNYLGRENEKNKYEVAFKFTEEIGYSEVVSVNFKTGLYGTLNPVVQFKPIKLKGNTIENASLGSYARFKDLGLSKGDIIKISYDIIPYVLMDLDDPNCKKSGNPKIDPPLICTDCGTRFEDNGASYFCPNKNCPSRIKGKILNYCNKMKIENISFATVDDLYTAGYLNSIQDLYSLKLHKYSIAQLPGYKTKKVTRILDSIDSKMTVTPSELFGSVGMEGISTKKFQPIFKVIDIDTMFEIVDRESIESLTMFPGVKDKTAMKMIEGIRENRDTILFLRNYLNVVSEPRVSSDFKVAFSKIRDDELEQYIIDNDGEVVDTVSKTTTFLVVPNFSVTSSKIEKAKKLDIPIILPEDVKSFIDNLEI